MTSGRFATRARREAARYGGDRWVFVRELIQNARDAGATRVDLRVDRSEGFERVTCRDDGRGMSLDHARRFLFTLYASSKRGSADAAGTFGVGFWSVLLFDPSRVIVRSRNGAGPGWQVTVDGDLDRLDTKPWDAKGPGTEIVLERAMTGDDLGAHLEDAVRRDAPFVRQRDRPDEPLVVTVEGVPATAAPWLEPPSTAFEGPGVRGVVGLGDTPRVVLYVHGLRVREAATLDELVEGTGDARPAGNHGFPPGLAGRVIVDADRLQLLAARGDARSDRELRRVVRTARRELDLLVSRQLDEVAPLSATGRLAWRWARSRRWIGPVLGVAAVALAVATTARLLLPSSGLTAVERDPGSAGAVRLGGTRSIGLAELDSGYDRPTMGAANVTASVDVTYTPADRRPWLAVLRRVSPERGPGDPSLRPDDGPRCRDGCLELSTWVRSTGVMRLPEPTGWRVDPTSVELDDEPVRLWRTGTGEAAVRLPRADGRLAWRAGRAAGPELRTPSDWPALPVPAARVVARVAGRPVDETVDILTGWVRERVRYDRSPETGARHATLAAAGRPLFDRLLETGAGDCDLQNALLTAMLDHAGVTSRLAVGALGVDGRAVAGLHAWVEVRDEEGTWRVVDASTPQPGPAAVVADAPATTTGVASREEVTGTAAVRPVPRWFGAVVAAAFAICAAGWWALRRRTHRRPGPPSELDPATIVRAALERPEAWGPRAALDRRPVAATFDGGGLSVARGRALAARRDLVAARDRHRWMEAVGHRGPVTVDLGDPAGRELAAALHLPVVDDWATVVDDAEPTAASSSIERALHAEGVRWTVREVVEAPEPALAACGWRALADNGRRVVLVRSPPAGSGSPSAQLDMARTAADAIGVSEPVSSRVMRRLARDLLRRAAG